MRDANDPKRYTHKPRRFCMNCGRLRETFYHALHRSQNHHCADCSERLGLPLVRTAYTQGGTAR